MNKFLFKKSVAIGILIIFIGTTAISGTSKYIENEVKNNIMSRHSLETTITIQPSSQDSKVTRDDPDDNFGDWDEMLVECIPEYGAREMSYVQFDLSSIPSDVEIISSTLMLYCYNYDDSPDIYVYEVNDDWDEYTITWNNAPEWYTSPSSSNTVSSTGWISWDVTDHVSDWVEGVHSNYGFVLVVNVYAWKWAGFYTKEYITSSLRPKLEVTYEEINQPPNKPIIDGPLSGEPGTEYEFTFNATDPEGDAVMYNVEWGDGDTEWTEYGDSGVEFPLKHTWEASGKYTIKAQAIDIHGAESDWANFTVTMPRDKAVTSNMLFRLLGQFPMLQKMFFYLIV